MGTISAIGSHWGSFNLWWKKRRLDRLDPGGQPSTCVSQVMGVWGLGFPWSRYIRPLKFLSWHLKQNGIIKAWPLGRGVSLPGIIFKWTSKWSNGKKLGLVSLHTGLFPTQLYIYIYTDTVYKGWYRDYNKTIIRIPGKQAVFCWGRSVSLLIAWQERQQQEIGAERAKSGISMGWRVGSPKSCS